MFLKQKPKTTIALLMALMVSIASCELETDAFGRVEDASTGLPIEGAKVVELAIAKDFEEIVDEGYTDSTGHFAIGGGLASWGPVDVELHIVVEKDGYAPVILPLVVGEVNAKLQPE